MDYLLFIMHHVLFRNAKNFHLGVYKASEFQNLAKKIQSNSTFPFPV